MKTSIVIPTLNEEKNIEQLLNSLRDEISKRYDREDYEILIVDGGSRDRTVEIAKEFETKILHEDKGKGYALRKGAKKAEGDVVVLMDADLSHQPSELGLLIEGIKAGYDICMGSRFIQGSGTADMPWYRKLGNKFFVTLVNLFWGMSYSDLCYGYRSFRNGVFEKLDLESEGFGIETEISIKSAKKNLKVVEVPSFEKERFAGEGKLQTLKDGWTILKRIGKELIYD